MTEKSVNDFIFFSDLSLDYGLIDQIIYFERIATLYDLLDVDADVARDILPPVAHNHYNKLEENTQGENVESNLSGEDFGEIDYMRDSQNKLLQLFRTTNSGNYCRWEFYDRDADPYPSVPHGHGIQRTSLRLDPYKRIVFEKNNGLTQIGFENKKFIKFLWNDNNFRKYALQAIGDFISSGIVGERYNWFGIRGIHNPRKLPKKRK